MKNMNTSQAQEPSATNRLEQMPAAVAEGNHFVVTAALNDRYAEGIIGDRPDDYDAIEVQGVRNLYPEGDERGTAIEVDNLNPQFYSVYAHVKSGGIECVGDMGTRALAQTYAGELHRKYGWPVYDHTMARN